MSTKTNNGTTGFEIAIIGMAGRFPKSNNLDEFWHNLKEGKECVSFYTDEELLDYGIDRSMLKDPNFVKAKGGILDDKDCFDADFFDYTPKEAEVMDPQIRIFHECAYNALMDAAYDPFSYQGLIGLYAGCASSTNWQASQFFLGKNDEIGGFAFEHLTNKDFFASRVAYKLNLKGPCVSMNTACSTSLVAIHMACRALLLGECNIALAGGVKVSHQFSKGYLYQEGMIFSRDGHCRAFDKNSSGTVGGEGVGVVVLKPLKAAIKDRDNIYAIIKGTAINNDGSRKVGFTAPSINGQAEVVRTALAVGKVEPDSIGYIEAHGAGTPLGDAVEIEALKKIYKSDVSGNCRIGSVKTNIGHLDTAAGVAGFIKVVLALHNKQIPPSLNYETLNPMINIDNSPFVVNNELYEWKSENQPLRAGVSSLGIGGTNAHIVLEEAPKREHYSEKREYHLLLLSAKTENALKKLTANIVDFIKCNLTSNFADVCFTLQVGRSTLRHKKVLVCRNAAEAIEELTKSDSVKVHCSVSEISTNTLVFMFSGFGGQYVNMGRVLYNTEPIFRKYMEEGFSILENITGHNYKAVLYPENDSDRNSSNRLINSIEFAYPLLFIYEYSLSMLLINWGIKPDAMIGYSFGEYVAACVSGVLSFDDGLKLVTKVVQLVKKASTGGMLSVLGPSDQIALLLEPGISIAIDNDGSCIVAGQDEALNNLEKRLDAEGYTYRRLDIEYALHIKDLKLTADDFKQLIGHLKLHSPQIRYISNLTGTWVTSEIAENELYWLDHLKNTVRFSDGIKELSREKKLLFLEIGPGSELTNLVKNMVAVDEEDRVFQTSRNGDMNVSDIQFLLNKIVCLWLKGINVDWNKYNLNEQRYRVKLPGYPFEKNRFPIEIYNFPEKKTSSEKLLAKTEANKENWFYIPTWKTSLNSLGNKGNTQLNCITYLVFTDWLAIGEELAGRLKANSCKVILVRKTEKFIKKGPLDYGLNPGNSQDYYLLIEDLCNAGRFPDKILHLWGLDGNRNHEPDIESISTAQENGFFSLVFLVQSLIKCNITSKIDIKVFSDSLFSISGDEELLPEKSTVLGPLKVIKQECPNITCRYVDIIIPQSETEHKLLISNLLKECTLESNDHVTAYRGSMRFTQTYEAYPVNEYHNESVPLRKHGIYLITGGLGKIGLEIAEYLARTVNAKLILLGRTNFPGKGEWDSCLLDNKNDDGLCEVIKRLRHIEELGGEVHVCSANVADPDQLERVVEYVENTLGFINGIIHSAGVTQGSSINSILNITRENCKVQFEAKVYGVLALDKVFKNRNIDFCLLMSSISTVLGGLGFAAYSAVNSFMDTFSNKKNIITPDVWVSANWGGWGLNQRNNDKSIFGTSMTEHSMSPSECLDAFEKILSWKNVPQVIVSKTDLQTRINKWIKLESLDVQDNNNTLNLSPDLKPSFDNNGTENDIDAKLIRIWQDFFGSDQIGMEDNFFDIGGDSLKAITLISKMHKEFDINIPISEFLEFQTVRALSEYIKKATKVKYLAIEKVEEMAYYPLASAQKRLLFLSYYSDIGISYNSTAIYEIEGKLDIPKLEFTFNMLIRRHEVLRTSFHIIDGQAVQKIHEKFIFHIETIKTQPDKVEEALQGFIKPFDLEKPPLIRVCLIETAQDRYIMVIDIHHIATDGVSYGILLKEIAALYNGGKLETLYIQYKDYACWQKKLSDSKKLKNEVEYWMRVFDKAIPVLKLATDFPRPDVLQFNGDSYDFYLEKEFAVKLKKLCNETETTSFMNLLTMFYLLLNKYSGQEDIMIGVGTAGRTHADLEGLIGLFVNILPIRNSIKITDDMVYLDILNYVKKNSVLTFENQHVQIDDLVNKLDIKRDPSRNPIFDVTFVIQNFDVPDIVISNLSFKPYLRRKQTTYYDLSLFTYENDKGIHFKFVYSTSLFKASTIEKMANRLLEIVKQVIDNKEIKVSEIKLTHNVAAIGHTIIESNTEFSF